MTEQNQLSQEEQQLTQKRIWISSLLGLFISFGPYLYTQRWQPLLSFLGGIFGIFFMMEVVSPTKSFEKSFERGSTIGGVGSIVAIADNWIAIARARKQKQLALGEDESSS